MPDLDTSDDYDSSEAFDASSDEEEKILPLDTSDRHPSFTIAFNDATIKKTLVRR